MPTNLSAFRIIRTLSVALALTMAPLQAPVQTAQTGNAGAATQIRMNGRSALFLLDDGQQFVSLTVTRDEIANTTTLSYAYRFPDPTQTDPDLSIQIEGEGEIPNSAFITTAGAAQLTVTTPDSYAVTRCVINNDTGEYTCAPGGPSTFDLTWTENGEGTLHMAGTTIETLGPITTRVRGSLDEVTASVSGQWDEHSGTNLPGFLSDNRNATMFREFAARAQPRALSFAVARARVRAAQTSSGETRVNGRSAFGFLGGGDLNGFVSVVRNEIANTTSLDLSYAFPNPVDSATTLIFQGTGEIPSSAFTMTAATAHLTVTTPSSYTVVRCVLDNATFEFVCAPATTPYTVNLTWIADGYQSVHETGTIVETTQQGTTRQHTQANRVTAAMSGTWNEHSGANMFGELANYQRVTISQDAPGAHP